MPICSYFYEHTTTPNIDLSENLNACPPRKNPSYATAAPSAISLKLLHCTSSKHLHSNRIMEKWSYYKQALLLAY